MRSTRSCAAGASDACNGEVFNVGGDEHIAHAIWCKLLVEIAGSGRYRFVEWPPEKKAIDIGSFYADSIAVHAARTGWTPTVPLREGLARTLDYYRAAPARTTSTPAMPRDAPHDGPVQRR